VSHAAQCEFLKADGNRCRANTRSASTFCYFHDPSVSRERHLARKRGGIARSSHKLILPDSATQALASVPDVLSLLETTANEVRRGQLETRLANCVGYLCSVALNGLGQMPNPDAAVAVAFIVQAPIPCPVCKTETGKQCENCFGMGYVSAPEANQELEA
jgi:hypothetical protein